jgi:DMSO/TMAO reductase YedYZ molybdopterin-dependent catalytic subunit
MSLAIATEDSVHPLTHTWSRRKWLEWVGLTGIATILSPGCTRRPSAPVETAADAPLRFPDKVAMRALNNRPPCLETPWRFFQTDLTPNKAFYVRWHLDLVPTTIEVRKWRLNIGGHVDRSLELSLDDLRRMEPASVVAVNQCSGNSRGLVTPHVAGAQWNNGAMGNARWTGVRLRDLLARAGLKAGAVDVTFLGLDRAGMPTVPDFVKALAVDEARRPEILVAYAMNEDPLPMLNGFPVRLVVPGWYATYWVKSLTNITVLPKVFEGFWMKVAYRIPTTPNGVEEPDALAKVTVPINRMNVRSFFVSPEAGTKWPAGQPCELGGIAFDGGSGIRAVEVSDDSGQTWQSATLGEDLGPYSFRRWRLTWSPTKRGPYSLQVRATSRAGETQPASAGWNRAGYMRNVIEEWPVVVV